LIGEGTFEDKEQRREDYHDVDEPSEKLMRGHGVPLLPLDLNKVCLRVQVVAAAVLHRAGAEHPFKLPTFLDPFDELGLFVQTRRIVQLAPLDLSDLLDANNRILIKELLLFFVSGVVFRVAEVSLEVLQGVHAVVLLLATSGNSFQHKLRICDAFFTVEFTRNFLSIKLDEFLGALKGGYVRTTDHHAYQDLPKLHLPVESKECRLAHIGRQGLARDFAVFEIHLHPLLLRLLRVTFVVDRGPLIREAVQP